MEKIEKNKKDLYWDMEELLDDVDNRLNAMEDKLMALKIKSKIHQIRMDLLDYVLGLGL